MSLPTHLLAGDICRKTSWKKTTKLEGNVTLGKFFQSHTQPVMEYKYNLYTCDRLSNFRVNVNQNCALLRRILIDLVCG